MANLLTANSSLNAVFSAANSQKLLRRSLYFTVGTTTAATTASGSISLQKLGIFTFPSVGAGYQGSCIVSGEAYSEDLGLFIGCFEKDVGTLTVSTNVASAMGSMPTKTIKGVSLTTAGSMVFAVISTTLVATTPVLTITYTNQDGTAGRTATMTLPTNALVGSAFYVSPHLQANDTAIRTITNISISTGSAGVIKIFCAFPPVLISNIQAVTGSLPPLLSPIPPVLFESGDTIGFYRGQLGSSSLTVSLIAVAESN